MARKTRMMPGLATGLAFGVLFWQTLDNLALGISLGLVFALMTWLAPGGDVEARKAQTSKNRPPDPE